MKQFYTKKSSRALPFDYQVRHSHRAKNTRIVVTGDKIEVVAPIKVPDQKIHEFVVAQRDWVCAAIEKMQRQQQNIVKMAPEHYRDGVQVPFKGEYFTLAVKPHERARVNIEFDRQRGFIAHCPIIAEQLSSELIRSSLIDWMMEQAKVEGRHYVLKHREKHQLHPRSLRIKTQKSRWGSCGVRNDINLNWLLIIAPPTVMEYVVVHELCHLRHRNHSEEFWQLVADHLPDYYLRRSWLKNNGHSLMLGI